MGPRGGGGRGRERGVFSYGLICLPPEKSWPPQARSCTRQSISTRRQRWSCRASCASHRSPRSQGLRHRTQVGEGGEESYIVHDSPALLCPPQSSQRPSTSSGGVLRVVHSSADRVARVLVGVVRKCDQHHPFSTAGAGSVLRAGTKISSSLPILSRELLLRLHFSGSNIVLYESGVGRGGGGGERLTRGLDFTAPSPPPPQKNSLDPGRGVLLSATRWGCWSGGSDSSHTPSPPPPSPTPNSTNTYLPRGS